MEITTFVSILALIALIIGIAALVYMYVRNKSLEEIRADVYQLFLKAEHKFFYTSAGKQKMEYVIQKARSLLPAKVQCFVSDALLKKVVQIWFDEVKDLLDDGKHNGSTKESDQQ